VPYGDSERVSGVLNVEGENIRLAVSNGVWVWMKRSDGRIGWIRDPGVYVGRGEVDDVYLIGEENFFSGFEPSTFDLSTAGFSGNGVVVSLKDTVVEETVPMFKPPRFSVPRVDVKGFAAHLFRPPAVNPAFVVHGAEAAPKSKTLWYVGFGFLAILGLFFALGSVKNYRVQAGNRVANERVERIIANFREAKAVASLNPLRSKQLLQEVQTDLQQLEGSSYAQDSRLSLVRDEMGQVLGQATSTLPAKLSEITNLSLLRDGMTGREMILMGQDLYILDTDGGRLVRVTTGTGAAKLIYGPEQLGKPVHVTPFSSTSVLILSDKGVLVCGVPTGQCQSGISSAAFVGSVVFGWSGNIYSVDTATGMILKYPPIEAGYGAGKEWLSGGDADLTRSVSMTIDGSIWISIGSELVRYVQNQRDVFSVSDMDQPFSQVVSIFTTTDSDRLYILDTGTGRVVSGLKAGGYQGQWIDERLKQATSLVVDEETHKGWVVVGSSVLSMDL